MPFQRQLISNGNPMEAVVSISRAVRFGPDFTIGGTVPVESDGNTAGVGDVVRTRVILTDIDNWKAAIDVRKDDFCDVRPVDTIMAVSRFVNSEWLMEREADAIIAGTPGP